MPIDTGNMMQKVYDYFNNLYRASSPKSFLVYQTLGLPINPDDLPNPAAALEYTSTMVGHPIVIQGNTATQASDQHVFEYMSVCLAGASPIDDNAMVALGKAKLDGETSLGISINSLDGIPDDIVHPVSAVPANWYDPSAAVNWSNFPAVVASPPPPPPPSPPPAAVAPPPHIVVNPITWRVLPPDMRPILSRPMMGQTVAIRQMTPIKPGAPLHAALGVVSGVVSMVRPANLILPPIRVAPRPAPVVTRVPPPAPVLHGPSPVHIAAPVPTPPIKTSLPVNLLHNMLDNNAIVQANTTAQTVTSSNLSISFEYCIVQLDWPWLPNVFLMQRNWYLRGYDRGSFSNGTGIADPGPLPVIPTGFIVLRNLKVSGSWSEQDKAALQNSAGLGSINTLHGVFENGTLSVAGLQIIGWFCSALPVLPPFADPQMIVGQPTQTQTPVAVGAAH